MLSTSVRWPAVASRLRDYLRADAPIYLAALMFVALGTLYMSVTGRLHPMDVAETFSAYLSLFAVEHIVVFPLLLAALSYIVITIRFDKKRSLAYRIRFGAQPIARLVAGVVLLMVAFLPFRTMFNSLKNVIPDQTGFLHDKALADFDQALHFGRAPFEYLYALLKHPWVLRIIETNYDTVWFAICFGMQFWVAVSPKFDRLRARYMLCYILIWVVIGNVLATIGSSAGPLFYGHVTGDTQRFAELAQFTGSEDGGLASTANFQAYLWYLYVNHLPGLGSGISAFPSMHVAVIVMNALFFYEINRRLLVPVVLYVMFVIMSSVYLGWHYAIDGYASAILTVLIFYGLKKVMSVRWKLWPSRVNAPGTVTASD